DSLCQQILPCRRSWRKMNVCKNTGNNAVDFLGEGSKLVMGPQPCLYMAERDLAVIGGQRCSHSSRCITMHQHHVWLFYCKHLLKPLKNIAGDVEEILSGLHDV